METSWVFPPGLVAGQEIARKFGQRIAEKPIQDDMRMDPGLGSPGSDLWVDTSAGKDPDDNLIMSMGLRSNLSQQQVSRMRDWKHRRNEFATPPPKDWSRPDAVCHTRAAKEYYEIKPMSPNGIPAADNKLKAIDEFLAGPLGPVDRRPPWEKRLPYVRGTKYMTEPRMREKEIVIPEGLQTLLKNLMNMFKLTEIRLFVVWERPMPAMILYAIRITVKTRDARPAAKGAMKDLAQHVLTLAVQIEVPEARLVEPPSGVISVDVPPELSDFREVIKASAGGLVFDGVPGETHLLVIDEPGFQRIIERQRQLPPLLRSVGPMFSSEEWQRILREGAAEQARFRDRAIVIAGALALAAIAIYVIAAAVPTVAVVGGEGTGTGVIGRVFGIIRTHWLAAAANDNAVKAANDAAAAVALLPIPTGYVFGGVKDEAAAERIVKTQIMMTSDAAFDPTLLLRPLKLSVIPAQFGDMVEMSQFGVTRIPGIDVPLDQKVEAKMRLIAKVTFS